MATQVARIVRITAMSLARTVIEPRLRHAIQEQGGAQRGCPGKILRGKDVRLHFRKALEPWQPEIRQIPVQRPAQVISLSLILVGKAKRIKQNGVPGLQTASEAVAAIARINGADR